VLSLKETNVQSSNAFRTSNNELPRSKLIENMAMIYPKSVTPECFNLGSSSGLAWIPDTSIRE
jgi:hypothetical protein